MKQISRGIKVRIIASIIIWMLGTVLLLSDNYYDKRSWGTIVFAGAIILLSNMNAVRKAKLKADLETSVKNNV